MRAFLLLAALGAAALGAQALPYWPDKEVVNVCTSEYTPMVYCNGLEPTEYSGYEIGLFENLRLQLGWPADALNWTCMPWDDMAAALKVRGGPCDVAVAGMGVSTENLQAGMTFTFPTYTTGLRVMTLSAEATSSLWAFMDAFTWDLWLAILLTLLGIGVVVWCIERWWLVGGKAGRAGLPTLQDRVFQAMGRPMQTADLWSSTFAGSLVILLFSFMVLILVTLYTANTAANLTATRIQNTIVSVADLPGKSVGTDAYYVKPLKKRNVDALVFPWDTVEDEQAMFAALRRGEVRALVLDAPVLEKEAAASCDVTVVGDLFEGYDQAIAFPLGFNDSALLAALNEALTAARESGATAELAAKYIKAQAGCRGRGVSDASTAVSFQQVAGLWILLGAGIGVACLLAAAHQLLRRGARRVSRTEAYARSVQRLGSGVRRVRTSLARVGSGRKAEGAAGSASSDEAAKQHDGAAREGSRV